MRRTVTLESTGQGRKRELKEAKSIDGTMDLAPMTANDREPEGFHGHWRRALH